MDENGICPVLFGIASVAEWLKVGKKNVYFLIESGMPCEKIGKQWVFHKSEVSKWFSAKCRNVRPKDPAEAE